MPLEIELFFTAEHWFDPNPVPPSPYYVVFVFLFAVVLGASAYFYFSRGKLFKADALVSMLAPRLSLVGVAIGGLGVVFVLMRYLAVPYASARAWVYALAIAILVLAIYVGYLYRFAYPRAAAAYREQALKKRYMPKPGVVPSRRQHKKKGKRRR